MGKANKSSSALKEATPSNHQSFARTVIDGEASAVLQLKDYLDDNFDKAVEVLLSLAPEGRVVVSGMGKAGFVAMKLSATLASTGVPSYFLHPAEALHGDLGRYTKSDIAIILSKSGETVEIVRMLALIKRIGCKLICITADTNSTLAKQSDIVLNIGNVEEVCPLGLAPTASIASMLALGDALAMTIQKNQNFTREQFAMYHPAGSLGQSLMTVSELMRTGEYHTVVSENTIARDVLRQINKTKGRPGAAAVVDSTGKLSGFFTDGDFMRRLDNDLEFLNQPINRVMTKNPKVIQGSKLVQEVIRMMDDCKIDQVVVVDEENRPVGLVDIQDLLEVKV